MGITNDIIIKGDLIEKSSIRIYYRGKFTRVFSNEVIIVFGYGPNWENKQEQKMTWIEDCFCVEIILENHGEFNFCFRNDYNDWDNNEYKNYNILIEASKPNYEIEFNNDIDDKNVIESDNIDENNELENDNINNNINNNEHIDSNENNIVKEFGDNENLIVENEIKENFINDENVSADVVDNSVDENEINTNEIKEIKKEIKSNFNTQKKDRFKRATSKKDKKSRRQKKIEKAKPRVSYVQTISDSEESLFEYFNKKEPLDIDTKVAIETITNSEKRNKPKKKKSKKERSKANFRRYKKNRVKSVIRLICTIILMCCITYAIIYFIESRDVQNQTKNLLNTVKVNNTIQSDDEISFVQTERMLQVKELNIQYPDLKGWIEIEGTNISYPLMQGTDNEYYMSHDYKKEYSRWGSLFLDKSYDWSIPSSNLLVYGHNFSDGVMLSDLIKYKDKSFFESHPVIKVTTPKEDAEYEIIAVFYSRVYYKSEKDVFRYYFFVNAENEEAYNEFVANAKAASIYDTGKTAEYGDQLITLSTCEYSQEDGRFAVVARKVK